MRFRNHAIGVRRVDNCTIVFWSSQAVYVKEGINCVVYHNWFSEQHGEYKAKWKPFRTALLRNVNINYTTAGRLARRYGVQCMPATMPNLVGKSTRVIASGGRREAMLNKMNGTDNSELISLGYQFRDRLASTKPTERVGIAITKRGDSNLADQEMRLFWGSKLKDVRKEDYEFYDEN